MAVNIFESSIFGFSSLFFEPILRYAGFFWTKLLMSMLTTGGAVMLAFYAENNDLIIWAWNLMGFPSLMYVIISIKEQAPRFPSISGLTIGNDRKRGYIVLQLIKIQFLYLQKVLSMVFTMLQLVYFLYSNSFMTLMLE